MSEEPERLDGPLPDPVRQLVVEVAAERLGSMAPDEVPTPLRRVARFEPRRRARLAATQIATRLETDAAFRARVAEQLRDTRPELAAALDGGVVPPAASPVAVAGAAYLLRPAGWVRLVEEAREAVRQAATAKDEAAAAEAVVRLKEQVAAARVAGREEVEHLRAELRSARGEVAELRRELREARERAREAEADARELRASVAEERASASLAASSAKAELRRLRARLSAAESAAEATRRSVREGRSADDARLHVLLDALVDAARGLRRELALPSTISRPADVVTAVEPVPPGPRGIPGRALAEDDPALLDHLLALPQVHLVVDGYNVTKTGYGTLPLETQRRRLLTGLAALARQTRAEVTCAFDGAELEGPIPAVASRGVRVLFSRPGETADELICALVRAEPHGRAVVVVSSDREVAEGVRCAGARPVPAALLLRRLDRG